MRSLIPYVAILLTVQSVVAVEQKENILDYSLEELLKLKVVTASKLEEEANTAPGDILVITQKQIAERGYISLEDVLKDLPSVDVQTESSSTTFNNIAIRGVFGNSKFVILQDGLRISSPTGEDIPVSYNFPLNHVKQIEFIYGPASALYGADAMSGVINLITLDDKSDNINELLVRYGENNQRYLGAVSKIDFKENRYLILGLHHHSSEGPDLGVDYPAVYQLEDLITLGGQLIVAAEDRAPTDFSKMSYSLFGKASLKNRFKLGFNRSVFKHTTATGTRPNTVDYGKNPFWRTEIDNLYVTKDWGSSKSFKSSTRLDYSSYKIDEDSKFANIFVDYAEGFKYAEGTKLALTQHFNWNINQSHTLTYGFTYQDFSSIPKTADLLKPFNEDIPISEQGLVYPFVGNLPVQIFEIDWHNKGMYLQHLAKLSDNLKITSGLRYDESSNYGSTLNPRIGLVYNTKEKSVIKLLYGEAFIAPTPRFTHDHFGSFAFERNDGLYQSFFMQIPNTSLEPEELRTIEVNYKKTIDSNLSFHAGLYRTEVKNFIDRKITEQAVSDFVPGGFIATTQIYDNVGSLEVKGGDLRLEYQKKYKTSSLNINMSYSFSDGDLQRLEDTIDIPFVAPKKFKINATFRTAQWLLSPSLYWYDDTPNNAGELTDGYHLLNLHGQYQLKDIPLKLTFTTSNLLDKSYSVAGEANLGVLESVPQRKRHVSIGFSYLF